MFIIFGKIVFYLYTELNKIWSLCLSKMTLTGNKFSIFVFPVFPVSNQFSFNKLMNKKKTNPLTWEINCAWNSKNMKTWKQCLFLGHKPLWVQSIFHSHFGNIFSKTSLSLWLSLLSVNSVQSINNAAENNNIN